MTEPSDSDRFEWEVGDWFRDRVQPGWNYWEVRRRFVCPDEGGRDWYQIQLHHSYGELNRKKTVPDIHLETPESVEEENIERAAREVET